MLRFPVARQRDMRRFLDLNDLIAADRATADEQEQWFRENGPDAPELLGHLQHHGAGYDRVLFWAYRYADTYFGLPLVADRGVLVPTAEEDPLIHIDALEAFFARPKAFLFLTPEEEALVGRGRPADKPSAVIGSGLDPAPPPASRRACVRSASTSGSCSISDASIQTKAARRSSDTSCATWRVVEKCSW